MRDIREAKDFDEDAVLDLVGKFPNSSHINRTLFHKTWLEKINSGITYIGVAEFEGSIVGYVSGYKHSTLYSNKPVAWIDEVLVREDMRKQGVGKDLINEFSRWAIKQDCRLIALASRDEGKFYCALGFHADISKYYVRELPERNLTNTCNRTSRRDW